ncbi:MAG TPA: hypothetical protein VFX86_03570 [Candidatus Saccharimonadales bacterium]|nr:hypothetical protein [Candidatus Saccharimonadales bacterium]
MTLEAQKIRNPDDYREFLRREAKRGSNLRPGSDEERMVLEGFKMARRAQADAETKKRSGTPDSPGAIAEELEKVESASGVVSSDASREARERAEIRISKAEDAPMSDAQSGESPAEHPPVELGDAGADTGPIDAESIRLNLPPSSDDTMH